jgi:hypothetical protein
VTGKGKDNHIEHGVYSMDEQTVQRFWQDHACGDAQVGAPPLPVHGLPGETIMRWHLWIHLIPRETGVVEPIAEGASL